MAVVALALLACAPTVARAGQLGSLISPGPLARAHQSLEGAGKCQQCHEAGRKVTASRCLTCHKPIADRMAAGKGVHRQVTECVSCHVEHAGVNAELRHLDTRAFNHAAETGYPLTGLHAKAANNCVSCHKTRSFLEARPSCASCHADAHKGALGLDCVRCHGTDVPFKQAGPRFDHSTARFPLTGAHREVACQQCHKTTAFKGVAFASCTSCHTDPHERNLGVTCTSCHTTAAWTTRTVEHARTRFPLTGAHQQVACVKCHQGTSMTQPVAFERCASCHSNVHRQSISDDCVMCHTTMTFRKAPFDHAARTGFPLDGRHEGLECVKCHTSVSGPEVPLARKVVDYGGARIECVSCHADRDPHKGTFGRACDACHRPTTFAAKDFRHPRTPEFFAGEHAQLECVACHKPDQAERPAQAVSPGMECMACHTDVHLGQLGSACQQCHAVDGRKFSAARFSHDRAAFQLTGKHGAAACTACHHTRVQLFPSRIGTAVVYRPLDQTCRGCHQDPHLGQVDLECQTCHDTNGFAVTSFVHRGLEDFFAGFHGKYACKECHKPEQARYPAGEGTTVRFKVGRTCASCHPQF